MILETVLKNLLHTDPIKEREKYLYCTRARKDTNWLFYCPRTQIQRAWKYKRYQGSRKNIFTAHGPEHTGSRRYKLIILLRTGPIQMIYYARAQAKEREHKTHTRVSV